MTKHSFAQSGPIEPRSQFKLLNSASILSLCFFSKHRQKIKSPCLAAEQHN